MPTSLSVRDVEMLRRQQRQAQHPEHRETGHRRPGGVGRYHNSIMTVSRLHKSTRGCAGRVPDAHLKSS